MRMIRLAGLGIILILLASSVNVHAQDEIPPPCDIDLSEAAALLVQAQAAASSGDTDTALDTLAAVRAELDAIEAACGNDEAAARPTAPELDPPDGYQVYEAPTGDFAFAYPQGWTRFMENGTVFTGTSEAAATAITRGASTLSGAEQGAAVVVGRPPELVASAAADATPAEIADVYRATLDDLGFDTGDVTETTVQGETGAQVMFSAPGYDGLLLAFSIPDTLAFGLVMASAAPEQREALETVTRTIAESITVQSSE